jgi:hypothetical protein
MKTVKRTVVGEHTIYTSIVPVLPQFTPKPRKKKPVSEKQVEADSKARVAEQGGLSLKFSSPGRRSVPDQIELYGTKPMFDMLMIWFPAETPATLERLSHALLAAGILFTECKRPGQVPTSEQLREHERLRALGFTVNVVDQRTKHASTEKAPTPRRRKAGSE